jgi:RNA polymerase sigma-70 factor (ECF subfamily)
MAGDIEAFGALMSRYEHKVFRLAQNITKNEADAEEVVQDAFMRVFVHLGSFHRRSKFSTWLMRIAINESLRKIRRRPHEISLDAPQNSDEMEAFHKTPAKGPTPEQTSSYREEQELVRKVISRIRPQNRNLLHLHLYQEFSYAQIARILGISNSTVRGRIYRAQLDLRKALNITFPATQKRLHARRLSGGGSRPQKDRTI